MFDLSISALLLKGVFAATITLPVAEVVERPDLRVSTYPGRVVPISQVNVVPQVSGEILEVCFENGALVKEGDILYRLDPVKYEAAVKNAESKVAECKANASYAELSYERHKKLLETRAVSVDAVDNALSLRDSSRAAYAAAKADLIAAKDDLAHCTIVAPISGKVGSTAMTRGNYAKAAGDPLVSIVQLSPIRVRFSISNSRLLSLFGGVSRRLREEAEASITLANGEVFKGKGLFDYVENMADEQTDTIQVFFQYENPDACLRPGGTVTVTLASKKGELRPAVPPSAVLQDIQGPYVWVLDDKNIARRRSIARGDLIGDHIFIEKGLKKGERIVADGAHKVKRGMTVEAAK
jgi:membrane fusion protein (multidrug efflux system)